MINNQNTSFRLDLMRHLLILPVALVIAACQIQSPEPLPTLVPTLVSNIPATASPAPSNTPTAAATNTTEIVVPATFTPKPDSDLPSPTSANVSFPESTSTQVIVPTNTPTALPTSTPTLEATAAPELPTATQIPATATQSPDSTAAPPPQPSAPNLLPNPSFEEGWYHHGGVPELQVPNRWTLEWRTGHNDLDPDPWNSYVRPESRLLNGDFLPPNEHDDFIWDGDYTVKIFKKTGSVQFQLTTNVDLDPGTYLFRIHFFPDLIEGYLSTGQKVWASDPLSGEVQFIVDNPVGSWHLPNFGQKNFLDLIFDVNERRLVKIGVIFRGRWAIENNGWFMDDWSLQKIGEIPSG